jgi:hypothetical protein
MQAKDADQGMKALFQLKMKYKNMQRHESAKAQMQGRDLPVLDRKHECKGEKFFALDRNHKKYKVL